MARFLLGEVTAEERDAVEELFATDHEYFEALRALEDELIVRHLKRELPQEWRTPFDRAYLQSPDRRRRVDEIAAFVHAASDPAMSPGARFAPRQFSTRR